MACMRHGGSPFGAEDPCDDCDEKIRNDRLYLIQKFKNIRTYLMTQSCTGEWPCDHKGGLGGSCWIYDAVQGIDKILKKVE